MRAAICFIYGFVYNLGNELFPPEVRCQSVGITEIISMLGGMVAPMVILFAESYQINALFLFGTLGLFALVASQYLPTPSVDLDDEASDVEMTDMKITDSQCSTALLPKVKKNFK